MKPLLQLWVILFFILGIIYAIKKQDTNAILALMGCVLCIIAINTEKEACK